MKFTIEEKQISLQELNVFETLLEGLELPKDYKEHMLKYNGGYPDGDYVSFKKGNDIIYLEYLHPIKYGDPTLEEYLSMRDVLPKNQISIGIISGGRVSISLDESSYGHIYVSYEDVNPEKITNSFTEFINGLYEGSTDD